MAKKFNPNPLPRSGGSLITPIIGGVDYISPFFSAAFHERRHTDLAWWCNRLNLSIHDRHEVQAALDRGENMQQFAQRIIRRGCV